MITTNQKPITYMQEIKKKESEYITNESWETMRDQEKKGTEKNY